MVLPSTQTFLRTIAVVMGLNASAGILVTILGFSLPPGQVIVFLVSYVVVFFLGGVFLAGAYGLWRIQPWSWWLASIWCAMMVFRSITASLSAGDVPLGADASWAILSLAGLIYLFRREMGAIFSIQTGRGISALIVGVVGCLLATFPYAISALSKLA